MRKPRKITAAYLQRVTDHYFDRYGGTSRANLRRLLMKRVWRSCRHHGVEIASVEPLVDAELDRLERFNYLDDARFAEGRARTLHRRGDGPAKIRSKLAAKGIGREAIDAALAALRDEHANVELSAALVFARKRRVGPWRRNPVDTDGRRKELGKLARGGFSWTTARQIVDAETIEELEEAA